jgi:3-deoxy-7-phosphoheptulonate synthase
MYLSEMKPLPSPSQLSKRLPTSLPQQQFISKSRDTIKQIIGGTDSRLLLVVGPCSIHDRKAALEYANRLKKLAETVSDTFFLVMRFYTEKSRTSLGWKGMLYDPNLDGSHDIEQGLSLTRELLQQLASLEIPAAAELLDPLAASYYSDLLSWGCIGARTTESQPHRLMASGLSFPVAFKNSTSGNIETAVNGALVASQPHVFLGMKDDGHIGMIGSRGNPDAHVTLRGGEKAPNYDAASIQRTLDSLKKAGLPQRLIIDCSHDNSRRNPNNQSDVFEATLKHVSDGNTHIRGLILESHINAGNQPHATTPLQYAVSITDPCIDWATTEDLIERGCRQMQNTSSQFATLAK